MTLQWEGVPCIHQNGEITGYVVKYWAQGNETTETITYDGSKTDATISDLLPSSNYSFQVAGINSAGTGVFSEQVTGKTERLISLSLETPLALNPDAKNPDVSIVAISSTLPCDWTLRPSVNYLNDGEVDPDCSVKKTPTTAPTTNSGYLIAGAVAAILIFVGAIIIILIVAYRRRYRGHISLKQKR
ncbi:Protein sidekick-2 [Geodia barretti]|nr:Protein sidekick-2 [Geodia barretti]